MRNLFLALLLSNGVFFGWAHWIDRPRDFVAATSALATVPALELSQVPSAPAQTPAAAPATRCRSVGPFSDAAAAGSAADTLRTHGLQTRNRTVESSAPDGYWVYVENLKDAAARRRVISTLNAAGMKDAAAMDESERVSVGVFSDQRHAVHRAEQVQELGFKPTLSVHQKVGNTAWLDMDIKTAEPDPSIDALGISPGRATAEPLKLIDCPAKSAIG